MVVERLWLDLSTGVTGVIMGATQLLSGKLIGPGVLITTPMDKYIHDSQTMVRTDQRLHPEAPGSL
jgi:hypothetical protein